MKRKLYITVDTECHDINNIDRYIWGRTKIGEQVGLTRILDEGKTLGIPINFFVDIAEVDRYGIDFVKSIVTTIQAYHQPIFLHLHPNFITGDDNRSFLWQYSEGEQIDILKRARQIWDELFPNTKCIAFRAGRYGTDAKIYSLLSEEFGEGLLDLSYSSPGGKMCHLTRKEIGIDNICKEFRGVILFPNTTYVGLKILGKVRRFGLDTAQTCLGEYKAVLQNNHVENIILTMHSWNFIKTWFFKRGKVYKDRTALARFRSMVEYAQKEGYEISSLHDFVPDSGEIDQTVDICSTFYGKLKSLFYNFIRFQRMARLSPKYFKIYSLLYLVIAILLALIIRALV